MLRFRCLGSGSGGNCLLIEAWSGILPTRILVDDGFSPRQLVRRLEAAGLALDDIDALVLTHEHGDHAGGAPALLGKRRLPVFATRGTARAAGLPADADLHVLRAGEAVDVGSLFVVPFEVPHDAREPVQFVFSDGDVRLALLTDIGRPTVDVARAVGGVDALLLECNHDEAMLAGGAYPPFLKMRIGGDHGHLSNTQAAQLLGQIDRSRLQHLVAAHLSQHNNRPDLARRALSQVAGCADREILVADQDSGLDWLSV